MAKPKLKKDRLTAAGEPKKEVVFMIRRIPIEVRQTFRAYCLRHGLSMNSYLIDRMVEAVKSDTMHRGN